MTNGKPSDESLDFFPRLLEQYRELVSQGEKNIDIQQILRKRCHHCRRCNGKGCVDRMAYLPAFEQAVKIEHFVWDYMTGTAELARDDRSPDLPWLRRLAEKQGTMEIFDDCLNAAATKQVEVQTLIPRAVVGDPDARNKLMVQTFLWLRTQVSRQLHGGNYPILVGRISSGELMSRWNQKFLNKIGEFDTEAYPADLVVGRFLNFMGAQKQYVFHEAIKEIRRAPVNVSDGTGWEFPLADDAPGPVGELLERERRKADSTIARSLTEAVPRLPEPHRTVCRMMDFEGKTVREVSIHLGRTEGSVKGLHRTAKKLVRQLVAISE